MKIIDISRSLSNDLVPWPGDTPFRFELTWKIADGAAVNVGKLGMSAHNGTHADAPYHFESDGDPIDRVELEKFLGPAVVVDLTKQLSADLREIAVADLDPIANELATAPRLLLKTGLWLDTKIFPAKIPVISSDVPPWLQARGVQLLGLDLPSVDPINSKDLRNHHALAAAGIAIIESLDLGRVESGTYQFCALPLKVAGGDAAPVRAVLWRD